MQQRELGRSGLAIAPLAFGGNVFGWTADEATSFKLLDAFVGAGFNFIDTADVYSRWHPGNQGGESEAIIGRWLKARGGRERVVIGTKVGIEMPQGGKGLSRAWITEEVDNSLRRLQTDYIDLYMSHRDDPDTPLAETLETYGRLIDAGKVRAIGASNYTADPAGGGIGRQRASTVSRATRAFSQTTTSSSGASSRAHSKPLCLREQDRRDHLLLAGERLPFRQVPLKGRPRRPGARKPGREIPERARHAGPGRPWTRWPSGPGPLPRKWPSPGCWRARASPRRSSARPTSSSCRKS